MTSNSIEVETASGFVQLGLIEEVVSFSDVLTARLGCGRHRPGGIDRLPAHGAFPHHRHEGRLSVDQLESARAIVGMMPFSIALQKTDGVELASQALLSLTGGGSPRISLAVLFLITAILGLFISNTATAILMAPVAIAVATELGLSPRPFALTVMIAASTAFMTPVSSPINTLVVSPGNYRFSDFVRMGTPFSLIVMIVTVILVPWLLPV